MSGAADRNALRGARTQVVLACLRAALGDDNVDVLEDDPFTVGVCLPDGQWFTVKVGREL